MHGTDSHQRIAVEKLAAALPEITEHGANILHGLDLSTWQVGRDLDVYIREAASHDRVITAYASILVEMGAEWVMIMPPIWGKRCIGVWAGSYVYCELHIIPSVRMGPVAGEDVFPLAMINPYGFCCDPWLYLFKSLLMKNKARVMGRMPLWGNGGPDEFIRNCVEKCQEAGLEQGVKLEFLNAFIDEDNEKSIKARRNGLIRFILSRCVRNPLRAVYNLSSSIFRKVALYFSPCVPSFELSGPLHTEGVQRKLSIRLGGVFPRVVVSSHKEGFLKRRKMQAMQQLFVHYTQVSSQGDYRLRAHLGDGVQITLPGIEEVAHGIMTAMARFNECRSLPVQKKGFAVVLLGPDGSGKSTLLNEMIPRTASLGRQNRRFHLWPHSGQHLNEGIPVTDPHALPPRGLALSIVKLVFLLWRYNAGWLAAAFKPYRRSAMIWFDRYYHDMLADPRRYRMGAPAWMVRLFGHLIPKPDLFLILDVRPEVARARKAEVSEAESQRQFHAYRTLAKELPNAVLIDANVPPEEVVAACERAVVEAMARRLDQRMGWKRAGRGSS